MRPLFSRASIILGACVALAAACDSTPSSPRAPASIAVVGNTRLAGRAGDSVSIVVRVTASDGAALAGQRVTFSSSARGAVVVIPIASTDAAGEARATWQLGTTTGAQTIVAQTGALAPLEIRADVSAARPTTIAPRSAAEQSGVAGLAVMEPPSVVVRDAFGNPVPGAQIEFAVERGGGRVTGVPTSTDSAGVAAVGAWYLGPMIGMNALRARVLGAEVPTDNGALFTAIGTAGAPARLIAAGGLPDSDVVGTSLAESQLPAVVVTDANGNPAGGIEVMFTTSRGGVTTSVLRTTDAQGRAALSAFTLDTVAGVNTIVASAPGAGGVTMEIVGRAGPAVELSVVSGSFQKVPLGRPVLQPLVVRAVDRFGNARAGVPVTFVPTGAGVTVAAPSQVTDAQGTASPGTVTLARAIGWQLIDARSPGLRTATFWEMIAPGAPAFVRWKWQSEYQGNVVLRPYQASGGLEVVVTDSVGNQLPDVPIRVAVVPSTAATVAPSGQPATDPFTSVVQTVSWQAAIVYVRANAVTGMASVVATVPGIPAIAPASLPFWVVP